jgi:primosomal protein N' (replication factor Y)
MPQIAKVAVAAATYAIDKPYDYLIPQGTDIAVGMRVLAPFGRGNRVSEGVVLALGQGVPDKPIKPIRSVVDREPVITDREIRLALWMRERYFCTFYDAIRTILPAAVWYSYREMWSLTGEPLPEDLSKREAAAACCRTAPWSGTTCAPPWGKPEAGCCRP